MAQNDIVFKIKFEGIERETSSFVELYDVLREIKVISSDSTPEEKAAAKRLELVKKEEEARIKAEQKVAAAAEKEAAAAAKEAAKIEAEAFNRSVIEFGFAQSLSDGVIDSFEEVEKARKALVAEFKKSTLFSDEYFRLAKEVETATIAQQKFAAIEKKVQAEIKEGGQQYTQLVQNFTVLNTESGETAIRLGGLLEAFDDLTNETLKTNEALNEVNDSVQSLQTEFDSLTAPEVELKVGKVSRTQLEKELKNLRAIIAETDPIDKELEFDELSRKIKAVEKEISKSIVKPIRDVRKEDIQLEVSKRSKAQLQTDIKELEAQIAGISDRDSLEFKGAAERLRAVKAEIKKIDAALGEAEKPAEQLTVVFANAGNTLTTSLRDGVDSLAKFTGGSREAQAAADAYAQSVESLQVIQQIAGQVQALGQGISGFTKSVSSASGGLKLFRSALVSTGVGAIVVAIGLLIENMGGLTSVVNVVTDSFAGLTNLFKSIPDIAKNAFGSILQAGKDIAGFLGSLFTFDPKQIAASFAKAKDSVVGAVKGIAAEATKAFQAGFDVSKLLRENDLQKTLLDTLNNERAARKQVLDAQLADATLTFEEQKKLAKQSIALEQQSIADEIRLKKERVAILKKLGENLTQEQKDEIRDIEREVTTQQASLQTIRVNAALAERQFLQEQQQFRLDLLGIETEKATAILQRQLDRGVELQSLAAEEERRLIESIGAERLKLLDTEEAALKARGKLTREEQLRQKQIANERVVIENETNDAIRESSRRRIEETAALEEQAIQNRTVGLNRLAREIETLQLQEAARAAAADRNLAELQENSSNLALIERNRAAAADNINAALEKQLQLLQLQAESEKAGLELQKESLSVQIETLRAQEAAIGLTAQQRLELEGLQLQLADLSEQTAQIDLRLNLDTDKLKADAAAGIKAAGEEAQNAAINFFADPLGNKIREKLAENLKIPDDQAQIIADSYKGLIDSVLASADKAFEIAFARIDKYIERLQTQVEQSQQRLAKIEENISIAQDNLNAAAAAYQESDGARQAALLVQIDTQREKLDELAKQKKKEADEQIALNKKIQQEEKKKRDLEKAQAIAQIAVSTAESFAKAAVAIAAAAGSTPFPANLVAIATTAAAVIGAVTNAISLAKFSKGGILSGPSHADGGIIATVGGRPVAEVEGGEPILTRGVSANPRLLGIASAVNQLAGGVPLMAAGGVIQTSGSVSSLSGVQAAAQSAELSAQLAGAAEKPTYVSLVDLKRELNTVQTIDQSGTF